MSKTPLEKIVEAELIKQVRLKGGLCIKLSPIFFKGIPDRMVLLPDGVMFFVELKRKGREPDKLQIAVHKRLRKLGFKVYVIDSKEQIYECIKFI